MRIADFLTVEVVAILLRKRQYLWDSYGQKVILHKFSKGVETSVKRVAEE